MKVRKKILVDVEYFNTYDPLPLGVRPSESKPGTYEIFDSVQDCWVGGLKHGDYIMTGPKGERYPCDADVFKLQYEEVKDPSLS